MKSLWSYWNMGVGVFIGVLMPIAIMNQKEMTWYQPLLAIAIGVCGLIMFLIPLYHSSDFERSEKQIATSVKESEN